jgi:hypothetical protein
MILDSLAHFRPDTMTFWGVGLTDSDTDLLDAYRAWASFASTLESINPSSDIASKAQAILQKPVRHCPTIEDWLQGSLQPPR